MARATKAAGVAHAVWSTLEDTRLAVPLDDPRLKTLQGKYKVPHFDAKGEADAIFAAEAAPTLGVPVSFYDMPFDEYRALGFAGADDMGNMYEHHAILGEEFRRHRSPEVARALNPALQSFDAWLSTNASRIPLG